MATDVKLTDAYVEIEGNALKVKSRNIMLDNPDGRSQSTPEHRRALVHDTGDKLTINYEGDYPGGVEIRGPARIDSVAVDKYLIVNGFVKLGMKHSADETFHGAIFGYGGEDLTLHVDRVRLHNPRCAKIGVALAQTESNALVLNQGDMFEKGVVVEGKRGLEVGELRAEPCRFTTADGKQRTGWRLCDLMVTLSPTTHNNVILTKSAIYIEEIIKSGVLNQNQPPTYHDLWETIGSLQSRVDALEAKNK